MVNSNSEEEVRRRALSFRYAFEGWWYALRTQRNAWIHALISLAVFAVAFWLRLPRIDWAVILLTIMVVWTAEFINTSIEAVVDLVTPNYHPLAKTAKDVAAASVLVAAFGAVLIGLLILGPPLWNRLGEIL
jgi:diacylglycerol kinase (ATP)